MKQVTILAIKLYQVFLSPLQMLFPGMGCRFWPTCSEYTCQEIKRSGTFRGLWLGAARILKCNQWN